MGHEELNEDKMEQLVGWTELDYLGWVGVSLKQLSDLVALAHLEGSAVQLVRFSNWLDCMTLLCTWY